jgi:phage shock protein B
MNAAALAVLLGTSDHLLDGLIFLIIVIVPLWLILNFISKTRGTRHLNTQDAEAFDRLSQTAARMEQRMVNLERILDAEVPNWRQTSEPGLRNHETI